MTDCDTSGLVSGPCSGELVRILREHVRGITSVKFDETGERLFSAGMDNVLNMWQVTESFQDPESEEVSPTFHVWSNMCV